MNSARSISGWLGQSLTRVMVVIVRSYQSAISPLLGGANCRYLPSCSEYFIESLQQRGLLVGTLAGLWRICRCHPLAKGGYDPVRSGRAHRAGPKGQE